MWLDERIGRRINVVRVEQALPANPEIIATACPYCAVMVGEGLATLQADTSTRTLDIAELVAQSLWPETAAPVPRVTTESKAVS